MLIDNRGFLFLQHPLCAADQAFPWSPCQAFPTQTCCPCAGRSPGREIQRGAGTETNQRPGLPSFSEASRRPGRMSRLDSGSRSPECLQSCVQGCSRLQHPHPCTWDSTVRAGNAAEADPAWPHEGNGEHKRCPPTRGWGPEVGGPTRLSLCQLGTGGNSHSSSDLRPVRVPTAWITTSKPGLRAVPCGGGGGVCRS